MSQWVISGRKGGGKTYLALVVMALLKTEEKYHDDRPIVSDIRVKGPLKDKVQYLDSYSEILKLKKCVLILDEAGRWANARNYKELPEEIQFLFAQSRKLEIEIIVIVQNVRRIDVVMRELTDRYFDVERPFRRWLPFLKWFRRWIHVAELEPDSIIWQSGDTTPPEVKAEKTLASRWMLMPGDPLEEEVYLPIWPMLFRLPKIAWESYETRQVLAEVRKDVKAKGGGPG